MMTDLTNSKTPVNKSLSCSAKRHEVSTIEAKPLKLSCGDLELGEYHQAAKIGEGAYGAITAVYDEDGLLFARKTFEQAEDGSADQGALREMSILRMLRAEAKYEFIVQAHDFCIDEVDGTLGMIMPKAIGSLKNVLEGTISLEKGGKARIAYQILCALTFLNDNSIMHRDVKPDNILLDDDLKPLLCDFSLAKFVESNYDGETHTGDIGTAVYMAPEVFFFVIAFARTYVFHS